jgi:hypothetical protein
MSFNDDPIVDSKSEKSEESVLAVKSFFSRKNDFLSRDEIPDYGVDLDVELLENNGASGKKFCIQIKSSSNLNYLKKTSTISLEFKTSRLGYLSRRTPGLGIIVVYDDKTKKTFFEYVETIINNITKISESDKWKNQNNVNIHIPLKNIVNEQNLKGIYERFLNRYKNLESLIYCYGKEFNIPVSVVNDDLNLQDSNVIIDLLNKYGIFLVNSQEFKSIYQLVRTLSFDKLSSSKELIFLAAVTYTEIGNYIEARYFIDKCLIKSNNFNNDELIIIKFSKAKVDFALGDIDNQKLHDILSELINHQQVGTANYLLLKINLIYTKITSLFQSKSELLPASKLELLQIFEEIQKSSIDVRHKHILLIFHAENFQGYAFKEFIQKIGDFKIKEKIGIKVSDHFKIKVIKEIFELINIPSKYYYEAYNYAKNNEDKLLMSYSLMNISGNFYLFNLNAILINNWKIPISIDDKKHYQRNFNNAFLAYNLFIELNLFNDAHRSLTFAYEIKKLFELISNLKLDGVSFNEIKNLLNNIESQTGIKKFESLTEINYNQKDIKFSFKDINDEDELSFAQSLLRASDLPENRLNYILSDIRAHKLFYKKCSNVNIQLLQDVRHLQYKETTYASPLKYILLNKKTGFKSLPYYNIEKLLEDYNSFLNPT